MLSLSVVQVLAEVVTGDVRLGSGCLRQPRTKRTTDDHDMMNFRDLVENAPDTDLLREMVDPCGRRLRSSG